jgi:hypothetical protein
MNRKPARARTPSLASGQLWQAKDCYVRIARVGKTLVKYKLLRKPKQRGVQSSMGTLKDVTAYLKTHRARLIEAPDAPRNSVEKPGRRGMVKP